MIQLSVFASPGGEPAGQCHCSQRPELVSEPSSSAKQVVGSSITSVWIFAVSTSLCSPWFCQNREVSVCSGSMITSILSFDSESVIFLRFGNAISGLKPWQI